ncbi:synemin [Lepisosteus oculatus]|uniref:synemin n=1 Tax=Lepisosteus oculatus TaxID=7918 RepID=UPI003722CF6E
MLQHRRPFENEKLQLQELNRRLGQYLSRVQQLERENARLATETDALRRDRTAEWERQYAAELRALRGAVDQLALERSSAALERDRLWRECQLLTGLCSQEAGLCREIDGELRGCEKQLQVAQKKNAALEQHLLQLQDEHASLEDAHRRDLALLREQVHARAAPALATHRHQGAPALAVEDVEEHALSLSEAWEETLEVYRRRIEELEESARLGERRLGELRREQGQCASQLEQLRAEADREARRHERLERELGHVQDACSSALEQYQVAIEQLEEERRELASIIAEKLRDHQELMQVKMGLSLEVAAYRALLEGERRDVYQWTDEYVREVPRPSDIRRAAHTYAVKQSSVTRHDGRKLYPVSMLLDTRHKEQASTKNTVSRPARFTSASIAKTVPISISDRSSEARRDIPSFTKASQASVKLFKANDSETERKSTDVQKKTVVTEEVVKHSVTDSAVNLRSSGSVNRASPGPLPTAEKEPAPENVHLKTTNITSSTKVTQPEEQSPVNVINVQMVKTETKEETADTKVHLIKMEQTPKSREVKITLEGRKIQNVLGGTEEGSLGIQPGARVWGELSGETQVKAEKEAEETSSAVRKDKKPLTTEEKVLDSITMEDIIEKVVKPAGLETVLSSSPDSKITYHVEKTERGDGTTKTEIILESKVQEDLDTSDDSILEELLNKGVKKVSMEDVKGTPTGSMIENLLSLGMKGSENLENKAVNVEIIEEPLEPHSDEENEGKPPPTFFKPTSMFFQIEELENAPQVARSSQSSTEAVGFSVTDGEYGKTMPFQEVYGAQGSSYIHVPVTEYFVSTPDENVSEHEESDFPIYEHYGMAQDLSGDESYWQEEPATAQEQSFTEADHYRTTYLNTNRGDHTMTRESFPECIVEEEVEEVQVPHDVQESVLKLLKEDDMDPKKQLKGALEQLQGTVTESFKEELAILTRNGKEGSDSVAVDIRKVEQSTEDGSVTIVAEINMSQSLEDSGLLEDEIKELSEEQVMSALQSANPELHQAISRGGEKSPAGGDNREFRVKVSRDQGVRMQGVSWVESSEDPENTGDEEESQSGVSKTVKHIRLGPTEKSFTFQMDVTKVPVNASSSPQQAQALYSQAEMAEEPNGREGREDVYSYSQRVTGSENRGQLVSHGSDDDDQMTTWDPSHGYTAEHAAFTRIIQTQRVVDPRAVVSEEKRIAAIYLDSPEED